MASDDSSYVTVSVGSLRPELCTEMYREPTSLLMVDFLRPMSHLLVNQRCTLLLVLFRNAHSVIYNNLFCIRDRIKFFLSSGAYMNIPYEAAKWMLGH